MCKHKYIVSNIEMNQNGEIANISKHTNIHIIKKSLLLKKMNFNG